MANHSEQTSLSVEQVIERLQEDYQRFPEDQSYDLYASEVYFKDPMNEFRGVGQYRRMIGFIQSWFRQIEMELHDISKKDAAAIETRWTLHLTVPLPWQPRLSIPGKSELQIDQSGLIVSHVDYWNLPRWRVAMQLFES